MNTNVTTSSLNKTNGSDKTNIDLKNAEKEKNRTSKSENSNADKKGAEKEKNDDKKPSTNMDITKKRKNCPKRS